MSYPGVIQTFEKLIQVDGERFKKRADGLTKSGRIFNPSQDVTSLDLEFDFLNSIILHSQPGYIKLASMNKCRFYDTILTDLLRSAEGKIKNVMVTYVNKKNERESAIVAKKDFLAKVVSLECPETQNLINKFQIKNLDETLKDTTFEMPTGREQCENIHLAWLNNPKTPYLCQIHEYIQEANLGGGDASDLNQRRAVAKILTGKLNPTQRDYLDNLCGHLDDSKIFCQDFLNVSFWNKIANGYEDKIFAEDICKQAVGNNLNDNSLKACLARMKKESDLCLYPATKEGLSPRMECDSLSLALNHSSLRSTYRDCPGQSDQHGVTNLARIILNVSKEAVKPFEGSCSTISTGEAFNFNQRYDNDENWKMEACYFDRTLEREVCQKTFYGRYGAHPESYNEVVANIIRKTRGADASLKCEMVSSAVYNPLLLKYKSGCHIIFEKDQCFISECKHRIIYNDRTVDTIKVKNHISLEYFATAVKNERTSQHYLLTTDFKQNGRPLRNLSSMISFFTKSKKGIIHGVGCGEDLLPSFFKMQAMNQCTPIPFIIDGMIREDNKTVFVTRSALDSLQAPRLVSWSQIFSTVKNYQRLHPLRLWTMYGLD